MPLTAVMTQPRVSFSSPMSSSRDVARAGGYVARPADMWRVRQMGIQDRWTIIDVVMSEVAKR